MSHNPEKRLMLKHCRYCGRPKQVMHRYPADTFVCSYCRKESSRRASETRRRNRIAAGLPINPRKGERVPCKYQCGRFTIAPATLCHPCRARARLEVVRRRQQKRLQAGLRVKGQFVDCKYHESRNCTNKVTWPRTTCDECIYISKSTILNRTRKEALKKTA